MTCFQQRMPKVEQHHSIYVMTLDGGLPQAPTQDSTKCSTGLRPTNGLDSPGASCISVCTYTLT